MFWDDGGGMGVLWMDEVVGWMVYGVYSLSALLTFSSLTPFFWFVPPTHKLFSFFFTFFHDVDVWLFYSFSSRLFVAPIFFRDDVCSILGDEGCLMFYVSR